MSEFKHTEVGLIPEDWEVVRLGEIAKIKLGRTPERKEKRYWQNGIIPWVKIQDLNNGFIYDTSEKISKIAFKEKFRSKFIPKGTLLLSFKLTIGRVGILGIDAVHHEGIASLFLNENKVNKKFLFFLLQHIDYNAYLDNYVKGRTLNKEKLEMFPIPLPPLSEQKKIAKVLDKIQQAIEIQDRIIEQARNLKKSLMQKLFTEGLNGEEQKETEIGLIPKSWKVVRLGEVAHDFLGGGTPSTKKMEYWNGSIPWMTSAHIKEENIFIDIGERYITEKGLRNSSTRIVPAHNLLIGTRVGVGKVAINLIDIAINQDLTGVLVRKDLINLEYLAYVLLSEILQNQFKKKTRGTTIKGIPRDDLKNLLIPLPPLEEQKQIAHILSVVDKKIEVEKRRKEVLKELFKAMLHKLMSGEIRLKEVEI